MQLQLDLDAIIKLIPDDPDVFADMLRNEGIRGLRHQGDCCPVTNFIARRLRQAGHLIVAMDVMTGLSGVMVTSEGQRAWTHSTKVCRFVSRFDQGDYSYIVGAS
jgi:hypothetical protein